MKKKSLKQRIQEYLERKDDWVHKGTICKLAEQAGYLPDNAGRRCRELENEGEVIREERKGKRVKSVWYRAKNKRKKVVYKIEGLDKEIVKYE